MRYMSRDCCNDESSFHNNNCCNPCNGYNNGASEFSNSWLYTLIIFFIFGGGFGPGSFWNGYNNIFGCSGFNNGWCTNMGGNNFNNGTFNTGNYSNNSFNSSNLSNANFSNSNFAGLLSSLSGDSNFNVGNLNDSSI